MAADRRKPRYQQRHQPIVLVDRHILAVDQHYVAINKEPGWPVHATRDPARPHLEAATAAWLGHSVNAVHRLDVWTSGVVLLARTPEGRRELGALFEQRLVHKSYEAVCLGVPDPPEGTLKHYLAKRRESGRDLMKSVRSGGKVALTDYSTGATGSINGRRLSLVHLRPLTGRTHQLRVQTSEAGWPILGDRLYGATAARDYLPGQLLHARSLTFVDPWQESEVVLTAPTPGPVERYANMLSHDAPTSSQEQNQEENERENQEEK